MPRTIRLLCLLALSGLASLGAQSNAPAPEAATETTPETPSLPAAVPEVKADTFLGFWEITENAGDTCIVIIKRAGRASCFWSTGSMRLQKGRWELQDGRLILTWDRGGYIDVFRPVGPGVLTRATFAAGSDLTGTPLLETRALQIDPRVPGSLTVPQSGPRESAPSGEESSPLDEAPQRSSFVGYWEIPQEVGLSYLGLANPGTQRFYVSLQRDGIARVALRKWADGEELTAIWQPVDGGVRILWSDGRQDRIVSEGNDQFRFESFTATNADKPQEVRAARRASPVDVMQYFDAGSQRTLVALDVRGLWTDAKPEAEGPRHSVTLEAWGKAYRRPAEFALEGEDSGAWRLVRDRIVIDWLDGSKDVIRPIGRGFRRESFLPGVPVNSTPYRVAEVIRVNEDILQEQDLKP